jgi:hypothetical protein
MRAVRCQEMNRTNKRIPGQPQGSLGMRERFKDNRHDVYQERQKWPEPTVCSQCGAVFVGGRWTWNAAPAHSHELLCPACRRIADRYPAGIIELDGPFFEEHREEILDLIRNVEEREKREHPLERLMDRGDDGDILTTTGVHLARRIGEGLKRAYRGNLTVKYGEDSEFVRVTWRR